MLSDCILDCVFLFAKLIHGFIDLKFSDLTKTATPSSMGGTTSRMTTSSQIEQTVPHYMDMMKNMFAIAYIWAFGGSLHDR